MDTGLIEKAMKSETNQKNEPPNMKRDLSENLGNPQKKTLSPFEEPENRKRLDELKKEERHPKEAVRQTTFQSVSTTTPTDREKFKQWLTKLVTIRAVSKGTTPTQELNQLRAEVLERKLKREGLLKDETSDQNQEVNKRKTE